MGFIRDNFLGGAERRAAVKEEEALGESQDIIRQATRRAEGQAIPLFSAAQGNAQQGFQGALDIFGQFAPLQIEAAQGGNLNAQNTLLAGLPQFQNAILGGNIDLSGLQAQAPQAPGADAFNVQLPQFTGINEALNINQPPPPQQGPQLPFMGFGNLPQSVQDSFANRRGTTANPGQLLGGNIRGFR